jgi:nucleotide-binding universal stress UspA family protein
MEAAMWFIRKILVATDFSEPSRSALAAAVELAKKFDACIVLMHAYQPIVTAYPVAPLMSAQELSAHVADAATKALHAAATSTKSAVPITTALYVGAPWEQILKAAKDQEADLIVMGNRGLHGFQRALLGSTAERVIRYAKGPVMVLHGPASEE